VIVGDTNMSDYVTFMKVGVTSVVLSMIEDPTTVLRDLTLEQPIKALREVSMDPFGDNDVKVRLTNGREMTAWEIQDEICERAVLFAEKRDLPEDYVQALIMWQETLAQLRRDPLTLSDRLDWVLKYQLIEQLRQREQIPLTDPRVSLVDLLYHDTDTNRGLFHRYVSRGGFRTLVSTDAILSARTTPPQTTRARMRGAFVQRAKEQRRDFTVDWVHLKLNDQTQRTILLKDPFKSDDDRFEKLLASL
jgi:proteasome accessory factor A